MDQYTEYKFEEINNIVDCLSLDTNDLTSSKVSLRVGNKLFDLVPSNVTELDIEKSIRAELEKKLSDKKDEIRKAIKMKMDEVSSFVSTLQREYEVKERELKRKLSSAQPMPEVNFSHAQRGLSVVKGDNGKIIWLIKRTYNPKFVDHTPIEPQYIKKMMSNIIIKIVTENDMVLSISTHYSSNLDYFEHYHQSHPDCWGNWVKPTTCKTADEILKMADDAISVLENINTMSIARRNPRLLPRIDTLRNHLVRTTNHVQETTVRTSLQRDGISGTSENDIWGN